jgi:uncharacterized protein YjbI with pentapeptide repeats
MTSPDHPGTTPPLEDLTTASPWVPLWRIIEQIASAIGDSREAEHYAKTRLYIRQAAAEGRLRIRGRHEIEVRGQDRTIFSEVYTEIPSTYWKHSVINVVATGAAFEADRHTNPEKTPYAWGPKGLYEPNCYTGLQLNSEDVSRLTGNVGGTGLLADARSISTKTEPVKFSDVVTLKPGIWGISIDLVKVWNWLREERHSLGRKRSKVIVVGIPVGIAALGGLGGLWYFHTQNSPLSPANAAPPSNQAVAQAVNQLRSSRLGSTPPDLESSISILRRAKMPLAGESLSGAWIVCQDLSQLDLRRVDASWLHGTGAQFREALAFSADFSHGELNVSSFKGAHLEIATFEHSNLVGASFKDANASNANFRRTTLQTAILNGALFSHADLSDADLTLAELRSANMSGANLSGAVLKDADISGTNFANAKNLTQEILNDACTRPTEPPTLDPGLTPPQKVCATEWQQADAPPERIWEQALIRFIATQEVIQGYCKQGRNEPNLFDRAGNAVNPVIIPFQTE